MKNKRRRRPQYGTWKAIRRCVLFFTTICIIPLILVLMVTTDHLIRPMPQSFGRSQFELKERPIILKSNNVSAIAARMEKRRNHLQKTCKSLGLDVLGNDSLHKPNPWEFLINEKHHLVWCNVFKAASTSWMYNFNVLAGYSPKFLKKTKLVPMNLARQKYPRPSLQTLQKAFDDSISFMIVRHPLERLLSAYRDKIQFALPFTHHNKLGREIVAKYRRKQGATKKSSNTKWPSFSEFVEYLLDCVKKGQPLDMHWTPMTEFCTPCLFDFTMIAHTETLQEDQQYLIEIAKLKDVIQPEWKNAGHGDTSKQIPKYYSELTRSQILKLYHVYRYDFELFNYTLKGYVELGKPDSDPSALLAAITLQDFPRNNHDKAPIVY